jgi:hypothetical protein
MSQAGSVNDKVGQEELDVLDYLSCQEPCPVNGTGLRSWGGHTPVFYISSPDQPQPGHIVRIQSCEPSGYDIGSVQERSKGCVASLLLYNF